LLQVLRERGPDAAEHVEWLEGCLSCHGPGRADLVRREHGRQAANQVTVGNCVTSLRLLSNLDWAAFFEKTSVVQALLRAAPAAARTAARRRRGRRGARPARGAGRAARAPPRARGGAVGGPPGGRAARPPARARRPPPRRPGPAAAGAGAGLPARPGGARP